MDFDTFPIDMRLKNSIVSSLGIVTYDAQGINSFAIVSAL
jgi:hypothetical protein